MYSGIGYVSKGFNWAGVYFKQVYEAVFKWITGYVSNRLLGIFKCIIQYFSNGL